VYIRQAYWLERALTLLTCIVDFNQCQGCICHILLGIIRSKMSSGDHSVEMCNFNVKLPSLSYWREVWPLLHGVKSPNPITNTALVSRSTAIVRCIIFECVYTYEINRTSARDYDFTFRVVLFCILKTKNSNTKPNSITLASSEHVRS